MQSEERIKDNILDDQSRRVLLMYITEVSGHRQATMAIQQSLKQLHPDIEAPMINGFGYTYPVLEKVVNEVYMNVITRMPKVWDYMYDNAGIVKRSQAMKEFLFQKSHKRMAQLFDHYQADTVVCTQAFPCGMVAHFKKFYNRDIKLIGVLTDFSFHSFWINEGVDYYVVPSEEIKKKFTENGVPPQIVKVYGIPIQSKFTARLDKQFLAYKMGLNPNVPTVLVMGGGQGLGPVQSIVKSLIREKRTFQIIVLAGTNRKILSYLKNCRRKTNKRILIYEFATNVSELMELAAMIVTKPGGITTAESLAKGLPMIIVNPIPGQEMRNTDFLIQKGVAISINDARSTGSTVEALLEFPERLNRMSQLACQQAKPNAASDIVKLIVAPEGQQAQSDFDARMALEHYV